MSSLEERLMAKALPDPIPFGTDRAHDTCRAPYNHDWIEEESDTRPQGGGWYLRMRCSKCGTIFRQIVNLDGSLHSGRQYRHPKDYRDPNHWTRSDWRLNFLTKLNGRRRS